MLLRCEFFSQSHKTFLLLVNLLGQLSRLLGLSVELCSFFHENTESLVREGQFTDYRLIGRFDLHLSGAVETFGAVAMRRLLINLVQLQWLRFSWLCVHRKWHLLAALE